MSKIAIISQPDQGVLIDIGGCSSLNEATHHLTSTLQIASEFWQGMNVDLNFGKLELTSEEIAQIISIANEVGIVPHQVFAENEVTKEALKQNKIELGQGKPMTLPVGPHVVDDPADQIVESKERSESTKASLLLNQLEQAQGQKKVSAEKKIDAVLYLRQTLRSGQAISHKGHLVIIGDVNPGAEVLAEGDITVWGVLRGVAAAGINGNINAEIRALRLEPIQLRIAHAIARAPDRSKPRKASFAGPETAKIVNGSIKIAPNIPE